MTYPGTARAATDINDDISQLLEKVAGFDVAWDMVIRSCDNLMDWLTLAHRTNTVSDTVSQTYRPHIPKLYIGRSFRVSTATQERAEQKSEGLFPSHGVHACILAGRISYPLTCIVVDVTFLCPAMTIRTSSTWCPVGCTIELCHCVTPCILCVERGYCHGEPECQCLYVSTCRICASPMKGACIDFGHVKLL